MRGITGRRHFFQKTRLTAYLKVALAHVGCVLELADCFKQRKQAGAPLELAGSQFMAAFPVVIRGNDDETPPSDEEQWTPTWPSSAHLYTQTVYLSICFISKLVCC